MLVTLTSKHSNIPTHHSGNWLYNSILGFVITFRRLQVPFVRSGAIPRPGDTLHAHMWAGAMRSRGFIWRTAVCTILRSPTTSLYKCQRRRIQRPWRYVARSVYPHHRQIRLRSVSSKEVQYDYGLKWQQCYLHQRRDDGSVLHQRSGYHRGRDRVPGGATGRDRSVDLRLAAPEKVYEALSRCYVGKRECPGDQRRTHRQSLQTLWHRLRQTLLRKWSPSTFDSHLLYGSCNFKDWDTTMFDSKINNCLLMI